MSDSLEVISRKANGSRDSRRLRRQGLVPAILYGHGEKVVELAAKREAIEAVIRHGSRVVDLKGAVKESALVRELQWDTYGTVPIHIDLLRVNKSDRIKVKVPIDLKGEAPGHRAGGVVTLLVHEIEIECTPDTVPEKIHAQVGKLEIGGTIKAHDLDLPKGAKVVHEGDETIVSCTLPTKKGDESAVVGGGAEPELIGRKPAGEGEGEAAEG